MKYGILISLAAMLLLLGQPVAAQQNGLLQLSKRGSGAIQNESLSLTLSTGANCDQTQTWIPEGSKMVSDSLTYTVNANGFGIFYGTVSIVSPSGEVLHVGNLRGTVGVRDCDPASGQVCTAVCNQPGHFEGIYESVPTFAPNPNGNILMGNFKADLDNRASSPPVYRARFDGWFTEPASIGRQVTVTNDKSNYIKNETIRAVIKNGADKLIRGADLRSFCSPLYLQRQVENRWVNVGECLLARTPFPIDIKPGESYEVKLSPIDNSAPPGVYRLAFPFNVIEAGNPAAVSSTVLSPTFRINDMPARDAVSVTTDRASYRAGELIKVTVENNTMQALQTQDHRSSCTIVNLQLFKDGQWTDVAPCPLAAPTRLIKLNPHESRTAILESGATAFAAGIYRIEFIYQELGADGRGQGPEVKLQSPQFSVAAR